MLAIRNNIINLRRKDLESSNAEMLACEIHSYSKWKMLVVVFYRPLSSNLSYIKEFKKALKLISQKKFDSLMICVDFNFKLIGPPV